jgi:hypothetical protein
VIAGTKPEPANDRRTRFMQVLEKNSIFTPCLIFNVAVNMAMG